MEDYLNARMIAEPLRLLTVVRRMTGERRDRDDRGTSPRPETEADPYFGCRAGWAGMGDGALGSHNMPIHEYGAGNGAALARRLYAQVGITAADIDTSRFMIIHWLCPTLENSVLWS
jgi:hypothetical protein